MNRPPTKLLTRKSSLAVITISVHFVWVFLRAFIKKLNKIFVYIKKKKKILKTKTEKKKKPTEFLPLTTKKIKSNFKMNHTCLAKQASLRRRQIS